MNARLLAQASFLLLLTGWALPALADTTEARCEYLKEGEEKKKASGACTFSQRQGYVDIDLRNGKTFSLSPGERADHFKDEKGHKVVRKASGDEHTYKWDNGRTIIVTFGSSHTRHGDSGEGARSTGETPRDLRDLVGGDLVGGDVDDELTERGYRHVDDSVSGNEVWSNWKSRSGDCVTVHFDKGRRVRSIVNAPSADCH